MDNKKYLQYYLDSKTYNDDEIQKSIENTKKEFKNKNIQVNVKLNEFGVYVITFKFENKNTIFNLWKGINNKRKERIQKRFEKYTGNRNYGQYKNTGIYRPY